MRKRNDDVSDLTDFAEWVAGMVCSDDFEKYADEFAELACRKLWRLGYIVKDGEDWKRSDLISKRSAEQKRGKWLPYEFGDYHWHKCSVCGKADKFIETIALGTNNVKKCDIESVRNYCPNCGARMERSEK